MSGRAHHGPRHVWVRLRPGVPALLGLLGLLALGGAPGCGYSTRRLSDLPSGTRTVAVVAFENTGFRRDLELRLTQAVLEEVRARSPYAIGSQASADVLIGGRLAAEESVITLAADDTVLQKRLGGTVDVTLTDRRSGRLLRTYRVYANAEFTPDQRGQSLEGSATDEWTRRAAERIVQGLERGF